MPSRYYSFRKGFVFIIRRRALHKNQSGCRKSCPVSLCTSRQLLLPWEVYIDRSSDEIQRVEVPPILLLRSDQLLQTESVVLYNVLTYMIDEFDGGS